MKRFLIFLTLIVIVFVFYWFSRGKSDMNLEGKAEEEINYLDTKIVTMLNKLNNITFENYAVTSKKVNIGDSSESEVKTEGNDKTEDSGNNITTSGLAPDNILLADNNNIDWNFLKKEIELLESSWSAVLLDLYSLSVNGDDILKFSNTLNICILSIKNENKIESLASLASLYSYLPTYLSQMKASNSNVNLKQTKSHIINAYALVEQNNWNEIAINLSNADASYAHVTNDLEYVKDNEYKVNKTYILIKEMQNAVATKDNKIIYIKYKNTMGNINTM